MKRSHLIWCFLPLFVLLFHYAYGERLQYAEDSLRTRNAAHGEELSGRFEAASKLYTQAEKSAHPDDFELRCRLRIDAARSLLSAGKPTDAARLVEQLLAGRLANELPDPLAAELEATLALSLYYSAYASRLELAEPASWRSEADGARQIFLNLYKQAVKRGDLNGAALFARSLEGTILLIRAKHAELLSSETPAAIAAARKALLAAKKQGDSE